MTRLKRLALCVALLMGAAACSKSPESPTSPSPTGGGGSGSTAISYTSIGASDALGVGSAVVCAPFDLNCPNGTGWVQVLFRRLQQGGSATLLNLAVPGSVLSPAIETLGRRVGRTYPGNFLTNQAPFTSTSSTVVTVFAGGNDANTIGQVVQAQLAGDDVRGFIDQQVRQWGDDLGAVVRAARQRAPNTKVVLLNLPNLAGAPYLLRNSAVERGVMQRIAVGMSERVNALVGPNTFVVDLLCDARILEPASFSSDGFHPSDRGYALMAELAYPAMVNGSHPAPAADCALKRLAPAY